MSNFLRNFGRLLGNLEQLVASPNFRFEYENEIEYENDVSILVFTLHMINYPSHPMSYNVPHYLTPT